MIQTLAFAGVVLFAGYAVRRVVRPLERVNIPAPVVGGLLVALVALVARGRGLTLFAFDTTLQQPLMIAFFTTVGFAASVSLLRTGGPLVLLFFAFSTVVAVLQNVVGAVMAIALGQPPLLGVLAGSVVLTGGPATGLAFAPQFEEAGVPAAATIAVAAAMAGIVSGGLIGGPVGTLLLGRRRRSGAAHPDFPATAAQVVEDRLPDRPAQAPHGEDVEAYLLMKNLVAILVAMWLGSIVSGWFTAHDITLPAYIGAMLVAAAIRNADDLTGWIGLSQRTIDDLGSVSLSLFLVLALMTLQLWQLAALAVPLAILIFTQVVLVVVTAWPAYRLMGGGYDGAVMASGFIGFMLGTTANAMANMEALVERYGPSPKAFLVVPMVGAFFIDFTNAVIITAFLNWLGR
jgi:ESS family glutamate:Na+ symporter